jgi:ankyrin repeat protein
LELRHALAVEIDEPELDQSNMPETEDMISVCAGLVTADQESNIIRLVHYTTQEFFERTWENWFPSAQNDIASICLTYLSFDAFETGFCQSDREFLFRQRSYPLYNYAVRNWGYHCRESTDSQLSIPAFFGSEAKMSAFSQALMFPGPYRQTENSQDLPRQMTAVHLAAYLGLGDMVGMLLDKGYNSDHKDSHGRTPLSYAAEKGYMLIVRLLAEREDVNSDSRDSHGRTPLSYSAERGTVLITKLLVEREDVKSDSRDSQGWTPLFYAARRGHSGILKLLLERDDVEKDSRDQQGWTSLSDAAWSGNEAAVKLFLDRSDVNLDSRNENGWTPLSLAAHCGHWAVVKLLLTKDNVDINSADIVGRTPLSWAAGMGHVAAMELLLADDRLDPNAGDRCGQTPLHFAARNGREAAVKLLLANDAVDFKKDSFRRTPLTMATKRRHPAIVELFREKYRDSGIIADEEYLEVPASLETRGRIACDICLLNVPDRKAHYHCGICALGDFDICQECFASGVSCLDQSHQLMKRMVEGRGYMEVPDWRE